MNPVNLLPASLSALQRRRKLIIWLAAPLLLVGLLMTQSRWTLDGAVINGIEILGYVFLAVCILGRTWCSIYIGGRKNEAVIEHGPYSVCRNPLYAFWVLGAIGVGLSAGSLTLGLIFGLACFGLFNQVIRREEVALAARFDGPYRIYMSRVPRWLPKFGQWHDVEVVSARPHLISVTFREASMVLLAIPALELAEAAQNLGWLPVLLTLP
jgi:protein-S-isoprenylcysteine O-methyltransferase Ste14